MNPPPSPKIDGQQQGHGKGLSATARDACYVRGVHLMFMEFLRLKTFTS